VPEKKPQIPDFEQTMRELEGLVERLEKGDLPLEEALRQFERGVALTRACQTALKAAEQKVEILLKGSESDPPAAADTADFEPNSEASSR
jgi:exodeoxyribonuclease VII small subunit